MIANIILKGLKGEIIVGGKEYGTSAAVNMAAVPISDREMQMSPLMSGKLGVILLLRLLKNLFRKYGLSILPVRTSG